MIMNATWEMFWITMSIILVIYYLIIIYIYYRESLIKLFNKSDQSELEEVMLSKDFNPLAQHDDHDEKPQNTAYEIHDRVEYFMEKLRELLIEEGQNNSDKQDLLSELSNTFKKFEDLKGTAFIPALHEFIIKEIKKYGQITLAEEELEDCWD
jgi:hypothetical protein